MLLNPTQLSVLTHNILHHYRHGPRSLVPSRMLRLMSFYFCFVVFEASLAQHRQQVPEVSLVFSCNSQREILGQYDPSRGQLASTHYLGKHRFDLCAILFARLEADRENISIIVRFQRNSTLDRRSQGPHYPGIERSRKCSGKFSPLGRSTCRLPSIASCNNRTFPQAQGRAARHFWVSCEFMDSLRFQLANTLIQCFGSNLLLVVVSICLARTFMKSAFIPLHVVLANSSAGALLWHTKDLRNKAPFIVTTVTISLWFVFTVYRWFKRYWRPLIGRVRSKLEDRDATKIELALTLPTRVPPGSYFRIFFPANHGYNLIGRPAVALWHPPDAQDPSQQLSVITFLLSRHTFNALDIYRISEGDKVRLEGPFGQDNHLGSYETVMLAAKGIGISGVLAQALDLAERRQHDDRIKSELGELTNKQATLVKDEARARGKAKTQLTQKRRDIAKKIKSLRSKPRFRDATRTVDLYWSLESNSQVEWVAEQLQALQKIDPHNVSLARLQFHIY